jgi:hypothetical protein
MRSPPVAPDPVPEAPHPLGEYFENLRRWRRRHYADKDREAGRRKSRAVLTIVHDEAIFLPIWLRYYSQFFSPEHIHVLDHQTTDGSTDGEGFVRVPVAHDGVSHRWMVETVAEYQHELMESHDVVLTVDVDEIVAPDPGTGTLGDYIDRLDEPFVNCLGYELIHLPDREPAIDLSRPILEQRHYWFANDGYDKPALAMEPMDWVPGFHGRADGGFHPDPDLRLIHLHRMDYEVCRARHGLRSRRRWGAEDVDRGWAGHNRISSGEDFDRWFLTDSGSEGVDIVIEEIPEAWRRVF